MLSCRCHPLECALSGAWLGRLRNAADLSPVSSSADVLQATLDSDRRYGRSERHPRAPVGCAVPEGSSHFRNVRTNSERRQSSTEAPLNKNRKPASARQPNRTVIVRIGAYSLHAKYDSKQITAAARTAFESRWETLTGHASHSSGRAASNTPRRRTSADSGCSPEKPAAKRPSRRHTTFNSNGRYNQNTRGHAVEPGLAAACIQGDTNV